MAKKSSISVGDGITQRSRQAVEYQLTSSEDAAAFKNTLDSVYARLNSPWGRHDKMIAGFRALWSYFESNLPQDQVSRNARLVIRSTEEWYVLQIVRYAKLVEEYVKVRPWEAISLSCEIGQLATEYCVKFSIEEEALFGGKMIEGRKSASKEARAHSREERKEHAMKLQWEGHSVTSSLKEAAKYFEISYGMMKKDYYAK